MSEKIKALRKSRGLSQNALAQYLGVSFQAVSKWENGDTMPDVALIPAIAGFFEVSTDELFDFNLAQQERRVADLCRDAAAFRFTDPEKSEKMLRDGLKQYPGNDIILNNLLYTMRSPERSEEVVTLCKSILEVTKDDEVKYDVIRILAETYHTMGLQALVKPTLDKIPEIYFSRLELAAKLLDGQDAMDAAMSQAYISRDDLLAMLSRISQLHREQGDSEKAEEFAQLTRAVYRVFEGRGDNLGYQGREIEWLNEEIWPRLK